MITVAVRALREVASALSRRMGTAFSAMLVAQGIPPQLADQLWLAFGVAAGLGVDVMLAYYHTRNIK